MHISGFQETEEKCVNGSLWQSTDHLFIKNTARRVRSFRLPGILQLIKFFDVII